MVVRVPYRFNVWTRTSIVRLRGLGRRCGRSPSSKPALSDATYIGEVRDGQRAPSAVAMELLKPSVAVHLVHVKAEAHQPPGREPADVIALPLHVEALPRVGSHGRKLGGPRGRRALPSRTSAADASRVSHRSASAPQRWDTDPCASSPWKVLVRRLW